MSNLAETECLSATSKKHDGRRSTAKVREDLSILFLHL